MNNFSKTYYTENLNITIRIKRDEFCSLGCRLTIKERHNKTYWGGMNRIVYTQFYNDKDMFRKYERKMMETKVPRKWIDEIMNDIRTNLLFEKVVLYQPIEKKMFWDQN